MAPDLVEAFVTEYQAEMRQAAAAASQRSTLSRGRFDVDRKIAGIVLAIEDGNYNPALTKRLSELEAEKAQIDKRLAESDPPATIALHPNLPALYRSKVEHLETALNASETRLEAAAVISALISRVVLMPNGDTLEVRLYGDLAQMLGLGEAPESKGPASGDAGPMTSVVAGTGFEPDLQVMRRIAHIINICSKTIKFRFQI
jgi:site-specific DNA recombinase